MQLKKVYVVKVLQTPVSVKESSNIIRLRIYFRIYLMCCCYCCLKE